MLIFKKVGKFLASIRLAIIIIIGMAVLASAGTIIESRFDAEAAKKIVYASLWMYIVFGLLAVNLIAVMVDRWPWKIHHLPFLCAHVGIILLIVGSILTMQYGIDGSMRIDIGSKSQHVTVSDNEVKVWATFDGDSLRPIFETEVDFFRKSPKEHPMVIPTDGDSIEIIDYEKYVLPRKEIVAAQGPGSFGAGLRFQFFNDRANVIDWVVQRNAESAMEKNLGPAKIHLGLNAPNQGRGFNEIYFIPKSDSVDYVVFHKDSVKSFSKGSLKEGDEFTPGWMGFKVRILRYLPQAREQWDIKSVARPTPLTSPAIRVRYGKEEHWVLLNDLVKLFGNQSAYILTFGNKKIDLGFPIELVNFKMGRYPGTMRASSYQSEVRVPGLGERVISMNEPLYYRGLKFFQASFQQDETGRAEASILSVNYDPGRAWKYAGSLIMTIGIILLFYFKKYLSRSTVKKNEARGGKGAT